MKIKVPQEFAILKTQGMNSYQVPFTILNYLPENSLIKLFMQVVIP
ncbi:MAG: hypothetical protein U0T82_06485 [Bacteroidales bacterium]